MFERELEREEKTLAAERGRSPSDAASVFGGPAEPTAEAPVGDRPPVVPPAAEAGPPSTAASGPEPSTSDFLPEAELADDFLDEESFPEEPFEEPLRAPNLTGQRRGRRLVKPSGDSPKSSLSAEQRLLILDTWQRSGLPGGDFATLVGVSKHTLYGWKKKFQEQGPAGLMDQPRGGPKGSRLPELTRRTILMLKQSHPDWGCQRISDMLVRGPALPASPAAVARALHEAGYQLEETLTRPHPDHPRHFERARPNQLWQTDLFTFMLKRQNRRVYLVAFMDDHSRFLTGYGLYASQSSALVLEVVRAAIGAYGPPEEILTDNECANEDHKALAGDFSGSWLPGDQHGGSVSPRPGPAALQRGTHECVPDGLRPSGPAAKRHSRGRRSGAGRATPSHRPTRPDRCAPHC